MKANIISSRKKKLPVAPYWEILKTKEHWAVQLCILASMWGAYTMHTAIPLYLNNIQHFSLKTVIYIIQHNFQMTNAMQYFLQNGALSALPYICMYFMTFPFSFFADYLINNGHCRLMNVRRLFVTLGVIGPGLSFAWLSFVGCNSTLAIVALCVMSALNAGKFAGQMMACHDMSPNYAGSLCAMTTTVGNVAGFLSPIVTGILINEQVKSKSDLSPTEYNLYI